MKRHTNAGLRKICGCPRRRWAACEHPYHFSYKYGEKHYRFSLDKHAGKHLDRKADAEDLAAEIKKAIRAGTFGQTVPVVEMTLRQLADTYLERYVTVERAATVVDFTSGLRVICDTALPRPTGGTAPFGEWRLTNIVTDTIERYREARRASGTGVGGTNRSLSRLRALLNWGILTGYIERTPFKRGTTTAVKLSRETPRSRRLNADLDEASKLLAACDEHLRAVVECALETGMRRGEIMSLAWQQIEGMKIDEKPVPQRQPGVVITWAPRSEIVLLAAKTKTKRGRRIPISTRLKSILEMRRLDPSGQPHAMNACVFGNAIGQKVGSTKRAWARAVLKAHGHKPSYTTTMNMTPESRAALQTINLHFHDLRREAGSRWLDRGVPLHTVRDWLGHSNVSQTSTYLSGTQQTQHDAMKAYEAATKAYEAALQQLATDAGSGDHGRPQSDQEAIETTNEIAVGPDTRIM